MTVTPNPTPRMRGLIGAVAIAGLVGGAYYWWSSQVPQPEPEAGTRDPAKLIEWLRGARAEAAAENRFVLMHFDNEGEGTRMRGGPDHAFLNEILRTNVGASLDEKVERLSISWGDRFMRWHLPEPLRWLAPVHGGERIDEICAARDSYAGDKHAARIRFMPAQHVARDQLVIVAKTAFDAVNPNALTDGSRQRACA